jgi:hypothetical protein
MVTQNATILERHLLLGSNNMNSNIVTYNAVSSIINGDPHRPIIKRKRLLKEVRNFEIFLHENVYFLYIFFLSVVSRAVKLTNQIN